jgi:hypothetical protein
LQSDSHVVAPNHSEIIILGDLLELKNPAASCGECARCEFSIKRQSV